MTEEVKDQAQETPKDEAQVEEAAKQSAPSPDEEKATSRGWMPKDKWVEAGNAEDDWKPAKVFNEVGDLKDRLSDREKEAKKLNKVVALMKEHHLQVRQSAYNDALATLKREREAALKEENFAKAEVIRDRIDEVKTQFSTAGVLPPAIERELQAQIQEPDPEFFAFQARNPWYKPGGKDEMSKKADALGVAYHQQDPSTSFKDIIKLVERDIRKLYSEKFDAPKGGPNDQGAQGAGVKQEGKVRLSEAERAVARSFGLSDAEYAKELESYKGR